MYRFSKIIVGGERMRNRKKIFALVLAAVMSVTLLSGCGGSKKETEAASGSTGTPETQEDGQAGETASG